jgi:PadR family transcriptional regulator PadR
MLSESELTALEQHALLAVLRLHPAGYGVNIRDEIARVTGRSPSFGTVYATLDRLATKGYVSSRQGEPTAERGGRRKLYFAVTARGQIALRRALRSLDALRAGTKLAGAFT